MEDTAAFLSSSLPEPVLWLVTVGDETRQAPCRLPGEDGAMAVLAVAADYFYSTGPGKLSVWKELLDELGLRGDEHARHRLRPQCHPHLGSPPATPGRATGADIWRLRDQTRNSRAAAERNAMAEGAPTGMPPSFAAPDAWTSRYGAWTGGRRSAFPATT